MRIHHIGYLVKRIEKAQRAFEELGYLAETAILYDPSRKVDILFMTKDGYRVELVSPAASDSVVSGLIKTYKNAPYHICYASGDFKRDLASLTEKGYFQIDAPSPAPALGGALVCFLMHPQLGMIELLDAPGQGQKTLAE